MEAADSAAQANRDDTEEDADAQEPVTEMLQPHDVIEDYFTKREDALTSRAEEPDGSKQQLQEEAERILTQNGFAYEADLSCWSRSTSIWIMDEAMVPMATLLCCVVIAVVTQWCLYYR